MITHYVSVANRHFYFVLIAGHLVRFKLTASSSGLHERSHAINLLDTYVTSGDFAALGLPPEELDDSRAARRYQDGLETGDSDRDTLIVLRCVLRQDMLLLLLLLLFFTDTERGSSFFLLTGIESGRWKKQSALMRAGCLLVGLLPRTCHL